MIKSLLLWIFAACAGCAFAGAVVFVKECIKERRKK